MRWIAAVAAAALFIVALRTSTPGSLLWYVIQPVTHGVVAVRDVWTSWRSTISGTATLAERLERVEQENIALRARVAQLAACTAENARLRRMLDVPPADVLTRWRRVHATIIGYDLAATIPQWVTVNRGARDGVRVGMVVVQRNGVFVGRVHAVTARAARVRLITHRESAVRVRGAQHDTPALVRGTSHGAVRLTLADRTHPLSEGEVLVTVRDGTVPFGLTVGTVRALRMTADNLFQEADIAPAMQIALLDVVAILSSPQGEE